MICKLFYAILIIFLKACLCVWPGVKFNQTQERLISICGSPGSLWVSLRVSMKPQLPTFKEGTAKSSKNLEYVNLD